MQSTSKKYDVNYEIENSYSQQKSDEILDYFKKDPLNLDKVKPKSLLVKFLEQIEQQVAFDKVHALIIVFASYPTLSSKYDYELNKALQVLRENQKFEELFEIFYWMNKIKKTISHQILVEFLATLQSSRVSVIYIEKALDLILTLKSNGYEFTQTFWKSTFDFFKIHNIKYSNALIKSYQMKENKSESFINYVISSYGSTNNLKTIFQVLQDKFEAQSSEDDANAFEAAFNFLMEECAKTFENNSSREIEEIYSGICRIPIKIKDTFRDLLLCKIAISNQDNFEFIERYLLTTGNSLTPRVIEKIISEYGKVNDLFSIFMMIKLCRSQSIPISLESIELSPAILKKVIHFLIDNSEISLEEDYIMTLSQDNQYYYVKNFKENKNPTLRKNDFVPSSEENQSILEDFDLC